MISNLMVKGICIFSGFVAGTFLGAYLMYRHYCKVAQKQVDEAVEERIKEYEETRKKYLKTEKVENENPKNSYGENSEKQSEKNMDETELEIDDSYYDILAKYCTPSEKLTDEEIEMLNEQLDDSFGAQKMTPNGDIIDEKEDKNDLPYILPESEIDYYDPNKIMYVTYSIKDDILFENTSLAALDNVDEIIGNDVHEFAKDMDEDEGLYIYSPSLHRVISLCVMEGSYFEIITNKEEV